MKLFKNRFSVKLPGGKVIKKAGTRIGGEVGEVIAGPKGRGVGTAIGMVIDIYTEDKEIDLS